MERWLTERPLEVDPLLAETQDSGSGALVVFAGTVRNLNEGDDVEAITYTAHEAICARVLAEIECEAVERYAVRRCRVQHRIGRLLVGETSVLIVVRAAHRDNAWEAARYAIDELKRRAPIWKREHLAGGASRDIEGTPLSPEEPRSKT